MSNFHYFSRQPEPSEIPVCCRNPFDNEPHALAILASQELQLTLTRSAQLSQSLFAEGNGKMFGVAVVSDRSGSLGYIAGFSGMLDKQWIVPGFVPPVFDLKQQQNFLIEGEARLTELTAKINVLLEAHDRTKAGKAIHELEEQKEKNLLEEKQRLKKNKQQRNLQRKKFNKDRDNRLQLEALSQRSQQEKRYFKKIKSAWQEKIDAAHSEYEMQYQKEINELKKQRKNLSRKLHEKVFDGYQIINGHGKVRDLRSLFDGKIPPGGTADCALPKLIQFAHRQQYEILAMAEFWWGASPLQGVRHHAQFYPPCRGKCHPIIPFMLQGVKIEQNVNPVHCERLEPEIIYQDEYLVVLNKPAGMLSIPGKVLQYSVLSWLQQRYPEAGGALLVHRLDMATSGLLLAAKTAQVHKQLQQQFIKRSIKKRYVAVLSKVIEEQKISIKLPLRVDLDDRPRQVVCEEYGKPAETHVELISSDANSSRVYFYPVTGRTHQLRVHAAHQLGLNAPIIGDELYGKPSDRLLLHAEKLSFRHPVTNDIVDMFSTVPF